MNHRLTSSLIIFILLLVCVCAVPLPQFNELGLDISFPSFESGKVATDLTMPFHVYRVSDGLAINDSAFCVLHINDCVGNHIYTGRDDVVSHVYDYEFDINNTVFSVVGLYAFNVYCECENCSLQGAPLGGFVKHVFEITYDGFDFNNDSAWLSIAFILAVIGFGMLFGALSLKPKGLDSVKMLMFFYGLINILLLGVLSYFISVSPSVVFILKSWAIGYISISFLVLLFIIYLYGAFLIERALSQKKERDDG